jgi:hypothetical protein
LDHGIADTFVSAAIAARTHNEIGAGGRPKAGCAARLCGDDPLRRSIFVWRPQKREFGQKVIMGAHVITGDPAIREDAEKDINDVVSQCAAIVWEDRWAAGIVK